ncbi:hypothetical protein B0J15DRAFT_496333 [Fusarium solani]|uniref:Uncharacterized protein n=1 Tax=Fusarium solani TaxID=169388 RepID=A0A9P9H671_FUSSL|nr:uncharacterized protein B0J15DRAFT_496333 [Fusarium solani]KAH7250537.1 hypothetical protein B0J15DRAFT_496333 [Fusarium solani]
MALSTCLSFFDHGLEHSGWLKMCFLLGALISMLWRFGVANGATAMHRRELRASVQIGRGRFNETCTRGPSQDTLSAHHQTSSSELHLPVQAGQETNETAKGKVPRTLPKAAIF